MFEVRVFDRSDIAHPKWLGEFIVEAGYKSEALDKARSKAQDVYTGHKLLIEIREVRCG